MKSYYADAVASRSVRPRAIADIPNKLDYEEYLPTTCFSHGVAWDSKCELNARADAEEISPRIVYRWWLLVGLQSSQPKAL